MAWQNPKTDWQAGDVVRKDDFNRIEGNTQELQDVKAEKADLTSHTGASSPHSGHATVTALNTHTGATSAHSATSAATANRIMMRDSAGRAKVAKPVAGDDVARKDTVDVVQSNLDAHKADNTIHGNAQKILGYPIEIDDMEFAHGKTLKFDKDQELWVIEFQGVGYIYNEGEEEFNIILDPRSGYETDAQKYEDHIYLYAALSAYAYAAAITELPVDLTNTKVLYFDVENTGSAANNYTLLLAHNMPPNPTAVTFDAYYRGATDFSRRVIGIDVSALQGTFYIGVIARSYGSSAISKVNLYRIWGE